MFLSYLWLDPGETHYWRFHLAFLWSFLCRIRQRLTESLLQFCLALSLISVKFGQWSFLIFPLFCRGGNILCPFLNYFNFSNMSFPSLDFMLPVDEHVSCLLFFSYFLFIFISFFSLSAHLSLSHSYLACSYLFLFTWCIFFCISFRILALFSVFFCIMPRI